MSLSETRRRLVAAGLRPTRPRLRLLRLLIEAGERHFTPDDVMAEVRSTGLGLPLATIYNTLNRFAEAGLLKRIVVGPGQVFFDTNTRHHHHVYYEGRGELRSVPARQDGLVDLPDDLADIAPERLDVVVRVRPAPHHRPEAPSPSYEHDIPAGRGSAQAGGAAKAGAA